MTNEKKGCGPLGWIAMGCGGLVLVGVIAVVGVAGFGFFKAKEFVTDLEANPLQTAAEAVVRFNPDLDLVETDSEQGTMTVRNTKTGEEATLDFDDIAEGKFSFSTDEGEFNIETSSDSANGNGGVTFSGPDGQKAQFGGSAGTDDVPDWVPLYPDATDTQGTFQASTAEGMTGAVSAKTDDDMREVLAYYKKYLEDEGYEIGGESTTTTGEGSFGGVNGTQASTGHTINVGIIGQKGETQIVINYNTKKN